MGHPGHCAAGVHDNDKLTSTWLTCLGVLCKTEILRQPGLVMGASAYAMASHASLGFTARNGFSVIRSEAGI